MSERKGRSRGSRRGGNKDANSGIQSPPYVQRKVPTYDVVSDDVLKIIEENAETILAEVGIEFRDDPSALETLKAGGAIVEGEKVFFPRGLCREVLKNAPSEFTQHARNPAKSVVIGGDNTVLVPAYGSPFVRNLDEGRRYATNEDFINFVKLAYLSPGLHHSGGTICEPVDLPVNKRHFDMIYNHIKYSDKPFMGSVTAPERAQDTIDMCKIVFGEEFVRDNCVVINLINANSPMTFDDTMLGAARVYAENNQATVVSPFILSGAMSPVTVVGTCAQILAEAMAGMTFVQMCKPGAPVVFGTFASSISMQSGAPTFGTPEPSHVLYICAALARRLKIPFRSGGGLNASKLPDAQAAYEASNTLQTAMLGGVNFMLHTAGWLEGGLVMSYEKFIMDADQAGMMCKFLSGVESTENGQAMESIKDVGNRSIEEGRHFLGTDHTQANFKTAFYLSKISDNNSFEQWESEGALTADQRANKIYKQMLNDYKAPELDPAIDEALQNFINDRKASFPDSNI